MAYESIHKNKQEKGLSMKGQLRTSPLVDFSGAKIAISVIQKDNSTSVQAATSQYREQVFTSGP